VPWDELDDRFRADNREQADHIGAKLATLPAVIVPATSGLPPFALTEAEVEQPVEMEHDRWMAGRTRAGLVYGPERIATTHPDMLAWNQLAESVKDKDRTFVRALPALLATEDLAIVRQAEPVT
jgi:hypothetical protein